MKSPESCASAPVSHFDIVARPDPQTLARLINYFAQRALIPRMVEAREADGMMLVRIEQEGLSAHEAGIVADKMRNNWLVEQVGLRCGNVHQLSLSESAVARAA
ncbi:MULTISPECIES: hypothetical protein [unclassified Sphingomonas]|uniref:hypothetical protein n=1 Tax=unclassified Sphingomonas TaxID=196159 RepID=UPI0006FE0C1A|nr:MULTISPECIES: hypothetical protein [unclassified Sphingomonas]KQX19516.1 hypothetical protein ASD17_13450 [Sphingomonas sp. Root1294]KQY65717.1 hypothetical protein ASD39_16650 [Sphingomonas sp. Root50]KRB94979.1 hypothetical protein ASE22_03405 [Sphingomonas sp. Root720]